MSEKPTMETDAAAIEACGHCEDDDDGQAVVPIRFARRLERERDEARAERDELYARHERGQILCRSCDLYVIEVNALREALRKLVNAVGKPDRSEWLNDEGYAGAMSAWERARALLGKGAG